MFVAYLTAGRQNLLAIFSDPGKFYGDDAYTFFFASLLLLIFGPGKFPVDVILKRVLPANKQRDHIPSFRLRDQHPVNGGLS
jgi:hypothetical protein